MKIEVLFFGITTDIIGEKSILFEISNGVTVSDFKQKLLETYPKLKKHQGFSIAVNMEHATDSTTINNGDTIALIPPVSGG